MSFANKGADSRDAAALRKEYESKARKASEQKPGTLERITAMDEKRKAFARVSEQIASERKESKSQIHRSLKAQGLMK